MSSGGATGSAVIAPPEYMVPYLSEGLQGAQQVFKSPYEAYSGPRTAEVSPLYQQGAEALAAGPTAEAIQKYMDPYQQSVTDIAKRESERDFGKQMAEYQGRQAQRGAFGGYRTQIGEDEMYRNQMQKLMDMQTKGLQDAYKSGLGSWESTSRDQMKAGLTEEARRQAELDKRYEVFKEERDRPQELTDWYLNLVRGLPGGTKTTVDKADPLKQTAGIASTLWGFTKP